MAPASSPSLLADSSRSKWKKRKRESNLMSKKPSHEDEDDDEDEEEERNAAQAEDYDQDLSANPRADPVVDLRESEVISDGGQRLSDFPLLVRRLVNRPHRSVLSIVAAERCVDGRGGPCLRPCLENISHGQLQVLSAVLPDNPVLNWSTEPEKSAAYVCSPPPLMEGKGVVKRLHGGKILVVPVHSDWFDLDTVHRLERQVVPHFFCAKSKNHNPERYIALRNRVVEKYIENPGRRLSFADCQGPVSSSDLYDLNRIVRFLDHWGIINFLAGSGHPETHLDSSLIHEDTNGELQLTTGPLKLIDSLVQFDRSRSSYRPEDIASLHLSASESYLEESPDLDSRVRERLSEHPCSSCSCPLLRIHYQSQKEGDTALCSDCYNDGKFIIGHSSLDFVRADRQNDLCDIDGGDSWTDQETFLLLEALEKYRDNWNEIADHVGTKSKAQCILHFVRLPMEDGLLDNLEFPLSANDTSFYNINGTSDGLSNGHHEGPHQNSEDQLPFSGAANPVMALVAFLATSIGPRVAAICANTALTVLTKDDGKAELTNDGSCMETNYTADHVTFGNNKGSNGKSIAANSPLSTEIVKRAASLGLSASAMKAKLFADQEEREIQRLTATIINYQLKKLELKLKQFAEIETLLMKECEQLERSRQAILTERARIFSSRFCHAGPSSTAGVGTLMATGPSQMAMSLPTVSTAVASFSVVNPNTRQAGMPLGGQLNLPAVGAQTNLAAMFGNNAPTHSQMQFMPRQPVFPFVGPRLPLSAIHPPSQAANVMHPSAMSSGSTVNQHPLLRSMSGSNNGLG